ncbi:hypothetical protein C0Q70_07846 [Pomacea canaliculata]|uniref:Uncharacterized protein n=1 Tax=Pomacea canaliculata TaxID=400727 RepID=A0A2T7PG66_POMCA|nr:hypothetical protein C0Q70_07846 [Pomacea canaliculata]
MEKTAMIVIATVLLLTVGSLAELPGGADGPDNNSVSILPLLMLMEKCHHFTGGGIAIRLPEEALNMQSHSINRCTCRRLCQALPLAADMDTGV